jgi:DNA-binding SARP family transcriptional activator
MSATPFLNIRLLGHFEVEQAGQLIPPAEWRGQKTRDLLKILLLARGHYVASDQIYEWLWPNTELEAAQTNLRAVVSDLRKILEPTLTRGRDSQFILTRHEGYEFALTSQVTLDTAEFERLAASPANLQSALTLYKGDLLEENLYAEWATAERQRLRTLHLNLLARLSALLFQDSAYTQCIEVCERSLIQDSTQENIWRTLMQAQAASGNRAAALATFERCRATLSRELGVDPSPETIAIHEQLLREDQPLPNIPITLPVNSSVPIWLSRLGGLGFALWALITGLGFALSIAGLIQGAVISPGDPGTYALPYLANHPQTLANLNQHLYLFFPTGWLLFFGYLAWFQYLRRAQPSLAWLGLAAGLADALTQTLGQSLGLAQLAVLPAAYIAAPVSQQLTLITIWDLMRQFASIAGVIGLIANPLALLLLLWASHTQPLLSKSLIWVGIAIVILSLAYYLLPDGPLALILGIGLVFGLRLWLIGLGISLWRAGKPRPIPTLRLLPQ